MPPDPSAQQAKSQEEDHIPKALIKECGLPPLLQLFNIDSIREKLKVRLRDQSAIGLLIDEVSPSADRLANHKARNT